MEKKPATTAELFEEAAALIRRAQARLDLSRAKCDTCGMTHYTNKKHWLLFQRLEKVPEKLDDAARFFKEREG